MENLDGEDLSDSTLEDLAEAASMQFGPEQPPSEQEWDLMRQFLQHMRLQQQTA